jgi:hypothetical protein
MSRAVIKPALLARSLHCHPARQARVLSSTALLWDGGFRERIAKRKEEYEAKYAERIKRKAQE